MKVVWATDFSENSSYVGGFLLALSRKADLEVLLLHVIPDVVGMYGHLISSAEAALKAWKRAREEAEAKLNSWEETWKNKGLNLKALLHEGDPIDGIINVAKDYRADVICVGTRGLSGIKGFLIGSFAKQILQRSPIPILTLRFPHPKLERILVPVDFSSTTRILKEYSGELSRLAKITVYHAIVVDFVLQPDEVEEIKRDTLKQMEQDFKDPRLDLVVDVVYSPNLDVSQAIVDFAESRGYDLILQASHGRTGIEKVIFGSVAEGVISKSHVPVLTINARHYRLRG